MSEVLIYDYETLSDKSRIATVVSLSVIACDWEDVNVSNINNLKENALKLHFGSKQQVTEFGSHISKETLAWWKTQSAEAQAALNNPDKMSITLLPELFSGYCKENNVTKDTLVLIRAPHFDHVITEFWYDTLEHTPYPYSHWRIRDVRSIIDTAFGTDTGYIRGFKETVAEYGLIGHNSTDDCIRDLLQVKIALTDDTSTVGL